MTSRLSGQHCYTETVTAFGLKSEKTDPIKKTLWQLLVLQLASRFHPPSFKLKALIHHSGLREGLHSGDPGQEAGVL